MKVSYDYPNRRFIYETINSKHVQDAPSLQFDGDKVVLEALGLNNTLAVGSLNGKESWTISVESRGYKAETYELKILINNSYFTKVDFSVGKRDSEEEIAEKLYQALKANSKIKYDFTISLDDETVTLTIKNAEDTEIELVITED